MSEARSDRRVGWWLFASFLALYLLTSGGHFYASDDLQKLRVVQALLERGDVAIEGGWVEDAAGRTYAWFPLGASLLMVPGYLVGKLAIAVLPQLPADYVLRFFVGLENAFLSAALVAATFWVSRLIGASRHAGAFVALTLGAATMIWPYAKTAWSEPAVGLLVLVGLTALWRDQGAQGRRLAFAGACLALACFLRQEFVIVEFAAIGWYLWRWHATANLWVTLARYFAPFVAVGAATLWYNQARYGHPLYFPNYQLPQIQVIQEEGRFGATLRNVHQYLLSPNQGLPWFSPPLLAGLAGLGLLWRAQRELALLWLCALGPLLFFYVFGWGMSSWAWGLRYTYVFVPFLLLPVALVWQQRPGARKLVLGLVALGVGVQLLGVLHDFNRLYERELARHPGLSIQQLMLEPAHAPLKLAIEATPATLKRGAELLATAPRELTLTELREARHHVPDVWPFLQLLSPIPRGLTLGAALALFAGLLFSASRLRRALR